MTQVILNLIFAITAIIAAAYVLVVHLNIFDRELETPTLDVWMIFTANLGWSCFMMSSVSVLAEYPPFLFDDGANVGWAATMGRLFLLIFWLAYLAKKAKLCGGKV